MSVRERDEALTLERLHSHPVVCFYVLFKHGRMPHIIYVHKQAARLFCHVK